MTWSARPEILLHPQIPKPLHGLNPRTLKGDRWWNEQRRAAYERSRYRCNACGVHKLVAKYHMWLEAHELYAIDYALGRMEMREIVALCHACHNYIHAGRMEALVRDGKMADERRREILDHGDAVLKKAGLKKPKPIDESTTRVAPWAKWHLVLDGKVYPTRFKDIGAWAQHYAEGADLSDDPKP